jgi:complement C1q subcomponent subunit C
MLCSISERQQYAFFATMSSDKTNLPVPSVVLFDQASLNVGEAYDETTGKFTCKVDGLYTFSWTTVSSPEKDLTTELITSGSHVARNLVDNDKTDDYLSSSSTVVVRMRKGEQTWISVVKGDQLTAEWSTVPTSMFSGFKIN